MWKVDRVFCIKDYGIDAIGYTLYMDYRKVFDFDTIPYQGLLTTLQRE